jgi:hypothetical protein
VGFEVIHRAVEQVDLVGFGHFKFFAELPGHEIFDKTQKLVGLMKLIGDCLDLKKRVFPVQCLRRPVGIINRTHLVFPVGELPLRCVARRRFQKSVSVNNTTYC